MNKKVYEKIKAKTKVGGNHYYRFKGCISECFEPYLNTYSEEEEAKIVDILEGAVKINERVENLDYIVLSSSCHLFKNLKDSLKRCLSFSNRKPLFVVFFFFGSFCPWEPGGPRQTRIH
jgi:hypothetical protein